MPLARHLVCPQFSGPKLLHSSEKSTSAASEAHPLSMHHPVQTLSDKEDDQPQRYDCGTLDQEERPIEAILRHVALKGTKPTEEGYDGHNPNRNPGLRTDFLWRRWGSLGNISSAFLTELGCLR
jgi:hypothetical protein